MLRPARHCASAGMNEHALRRTLLQHGMDAIRCFGDRAQPQSNRIVDDARLPPRGDWCSTIPHTPRCCSLRNRRLDCAGLTTTERCMAAAVSAEPVPRRSVRARGRDGSFAECPALKTPGVSPQRRGHDHSHSSPAAPVRAARRLAPKTAESIRYSLISRALLARALEDSCNYRAHGRRQG